MACSNGVLGTFFRAVALLSMVVLPGCELAAEEGELGPPASQSGVTSGESSGGGGSGGDEEEDPPCEEGARRTCRVNLGTNGSITSCFEGVETCENGVWGYCQPARDDDDDEDGEGERRAPGEDPGADGGFHATNAAEAGGAAQVLFGADGAVPCFDNPCDPSCMKHQEAPPGGITPPDTTVYDWDTGTLSDLSPSLAGRGTVEPCADGADCQFDQVCENPVTGEACAHSKCETGAGLVAGCDPCVASICDAQPSCCKSVVGAACAHDLCETGSYVKASCDPCAASICSNPLYAYCCSSWGQWNSTCVSRVAQVCGKTCGAGSWTQSCADRVSSVCGAVCPPAGCGAGCEPPGECTPWLAGEKYADCAGVDLTASVPCTASGKRSLPVCNRGKSTAPAGIPIAVFPSNSGKMPQKSPSLTGASFCATAEPIPPGQCIDVTTCTLTGATEVMVNPPGKAGSVAECHSNNNWTATPTSPQACAAPACAGGSLTGEVKKVNLFFAIDRSGSMLEKSYSIPGQPTRWKQTSDALKAFLEDQKSAGFGVWMRFWPYNQNGACPSAYSYGCSSTGCASPNVALADLTAAAAPADTQEAKLIAAIDQAAPELFGSTPMYPALQGVLSAAQAYQAANPDEVAVVVLVTDGEATQCTTSVSSIAGLAASAHSSSGVRTFVIGIADVSQSTIAAIASAGGGQHFLVAPGAAVKVDQQVIAALDAIRNQVGSCGFSLPAASSFDPASMAVKRVSSAGAVQNVAQVSGSGACGSGGGWYYDNPSAPGVLHLCPATCEAVRADPGSKVELRAGCPGGFDPLVFEEVYEATCPKGTHPVWGHLSYSTSTPSTSKVEIGVVTGTSPVFAPEVVDVPVAVAQTSTGTSVCGMGGPAPCPIRLSPALGGAPAHHLRYLRLRARLVPSASGAVAPTLVDWRVTYSCPDAE